MSSFTT